MSFALIRAPKAAPHAHPAARLDLNAFARAGAVHPELVRRLVALGLLEPERDASGSLWFVPAELAVLGRILRLRAGFGLNYAALGLVVDLLDRVGELEADRRRSGRRNPIRHIGD